jgi:hypothetical protein
LWFKVKPSTRCVSADGLSDGDPAQMGFGLGTETESVTQPNLIDYVAGIKGVPCTMHECESLEYATGHGFVSGSEV